MGTVAGMELWVTPAVYAELMDAERREVGLSEGGRSWGVEMRKVLEKYLPENTIVAMPNPIPVHVRRGMLQPCRALVPDARTCNVCGGDRYREHSAGFCA